MNYAMNVIILQKILLKNNSLENQNNGNNTNIEKINIKIDEKHTYIIGKNGPTIKYNKEDGKLGFYGVKPDLNIDKLKEGKYKLEEIIVSSEDNNKLLGQYKGNELYLEYHSKSENTLIMKSPSPHLF